MSMNGKQGDTGNMAVEGRKYYRYVPAVAIDKYHLIVSIAGRHSFRHLLLNINQLNFEYPIP